MIAFPLTSKAYVDDGAHPIPKLDVVVFANCVFPATEKDTPPYVPVMLFELLMEVDTNRFTVQGKVKLIV